MFERIYTKYTEKMIILRDAVRQVPAQWLMEPPSRTPFYALTAPHSVTQPPRMRLQ